MAGHTICVATYPFRQVKQLNNSMKKKHEQVIDPCIQICTIDPDSGLCIGCSRTPEEIDNWFLMTPEEKIELVKKLKNR